MRKRMTLLWSAAITVGLIGATLTLAQEPPAEGEKADAPPKMPRVERMFNVIDADKDGVISKEEFQSHFENMPMQAGMGRGGFPQGPRFNGRGAQGFQRGGPGMPGRGYGRGPMMGQGPMQYGGPPMFEPGPQSGFQRGGPGMPGRGYGRGPMMGQGPMQYGGPPMFGPGPQGGFQRGGPDAMQGPREDRGPRNDARGSRGDMPTQSY